MTSLMDDLGAAQKEAEALRTSSPRPSPWRSRRTIVASNRSRVLVARLDGVDPAALKSAAESLIAKLAGEAGEAGAAVVLGSGSAGGGKVGLVAIFDDEVQSARGLKAGAVLGAAAKACGGGGGGKPGFAQAGGRDATQLDAALDGARDTIVAALSKWGESDGGEINRSEVAITPEAAAA